jgi:hypothetical protein
VFTRLPTLQLALNTVALFINSLIYNLPEPGANSGRPQWLHGLKHEPSSPARTRRSWVRIPLKAWMSVCVYSVFVLSCVQVAAL